MNVQFLPFSLRGAAAMDPAGWSQDETRRWVTASVAVLADERQDKPVRPRVALLGPGDVEGIDPSQIVRRTPPPGHQEMAPNHLVTVEFAHPDLPWLFSADPAPTTNRMLPWLMLVVVEPQPGEQVVTRRAGMASPVLSVDASRLPNPAHAWAWAHVQVHATDPATARQDLAGGGPWPLARSRLVAPCVLRPGAGYVACLVPVFQASPGPALHWPTQGPVTLPVYDHWSFSTSQVAGDFRDLALVLHPPSAFEAGYRGVVVDPVAARLSRPGDPPLFPSEVRHVATALSRGTAEERPVPPALGARLKALLDRSAGDGGTAEGAKPVVGPPLYGQWPAGVDSLDGSPGTNGAVPAPGGAQGWVTELNANPDLRVVAGLGARMVQLHQEDLMAEAWAQLQVVEEANRRIRWAQLAAAAATPLHQAVAELHPADALRIARPVFRPPSSPASTDSPVSAEELVPLTPEGVAISESLAVANVPEEVLSPAFLRTARYATAEPTGVVDTAFDAVQAGEPEALPVHLGDPPAIDLDQLTQVLQGAELELPVLDQALSALDHLSSPGTTVEQVADDLLAAIPQIDPSGFVYDESAGRFVAASDRPEVPGETRTAGTSVDDMLIVEGAPDDLSTPAVRQVTTVEPTGVADATDAVALDDALPATFEETVDDIGRVAVLGPAERAKLGGIAELERAVLFAMAMPSPPSDTWATWRNEGSGMMVVDVAANMTQVQRLEVGADDVAGELEPEGSYSDMLAAAITLDEGAPSHPRQRSPLHPVMAAPVFATPVVELLRAMDQDWVLGGVGSLGEDNVIAALTENHRFVEAFLAGANHEMARELRWRGYPTDMRGSYFRRFWPTLSEKPEAFFASAASPSGITGPDDPAAAPHDDVRPLHEWTAPLGGNHDVDVEHLLVLVIKGPLLRRYPNTVITIELGSHDTHAFASAGTARLLASGRLDPDLAYLIFDADLALEQDGRRWFVSVREPTDEPSFRLDVADAAGLPFLTPDKANPHARRAPHDTSLAVVEWLHRRPFQLLLPLREILEGQPS